MRASRLYRTLTVLNSDLLGKLNRARDAWSLDMLSSKEKFTHGFCTRNYGMALSTKIVAVFVLATLRGEWDDTAKSERARLCREVCFLAETDATHHRPLGSSWILLALTMAYAASGTAEDKQRVVGLLTEYKGDFPTEAREVSVNLMEMIAPWLSCSDLLRSKLSIMKEPIIYGVEDLTTA